MSNEAVVQRTRVNKTIPIIRRIIEHTIRRPHPGKAAPWKGDRVNVVQVEPDWSIEYGLGNSPKIWRAAADGSLGAWIEQPSLVMSWTRPYTGLSAKASLSHPDELIVAKHAGANAAVSIYMTALESTLMDDLVQTVRDRRGAKPLADLARPLGLRADLAKAIAMAEAEKKPRKTGRRQIEREPPGGFVDNATIKKSPAQPGREKKSPVQLDAELDDWLREQQR